MATKTINGAVVDSAVLYRKAGVSKRHRDFRIQDSKSEQWNNHYNKLKEAYSRGGISILIGDRGCGKTQASACLIGHSTYGEFKSAIYTKAFDIFLNIRDGFNNNSKATEVQQVKKYTDAHLLVIDAYEVRGDTEFENRTLDHIIDKRYDMQRPTVIITNDTAQKFGEVLGKSIKDRIKDGGGVLVYEGESMRGNG